MDILTLFTDVDDFCLFFEPHWQAKMIADKPRLRNRAATLCLSEVITILVLFHSSGYRNFKQFYLEHVAVHWRQEFPALVSYNRFVELQTEAMLALWAYLLTRRGTCSGISFVDSTALAVCHNRRIKQHRTFAERAARGKTSVDWFFGFKLHLIVNDCGELLAFHLSPGNTDDRRPLPQLIREVWGKLFGDKGYVSAALAQQLQEQGVELITKLKKNMKNKLLPMFDQIMLRKRAIIESVIDQLKNISQIEHTRHRSLSNYLGNIAAGLIAYSWREKKPSLEIRLKEQFGLESVAF